MRCVGVGIARRRQRHAHGQNLIRRHTEIHVLDRDEGRTSRLEPARSISESATSATTSPLRRIAWLEPPARPRPASRIDWATSRPELCSAGANPHRTLVTIERPSVKIKHRRVQRDLGLVGNRPRWHQREDGGQPAVGEEHADRAGYEREDQALRQELPHESSAAGAERGPNRHLALTRRRLREQEIRDVRAGDHEEQRDGTKQHPDVAGDAARERLLERQQPDPPLVRKLIRLARLEIRDDRPQIR